MIRFLITIPTRWCSTGPSPVPIARDSSGCRIPLAGFLALILLLLTARPNLLAQSLEIRAQVDKHDVEFGETVQYTITVRGPDLSSIRTPSPPAARGLQPTQINPTTRRSFSVQGNRRQREVSFIWSFRPTQPGKAAISAARVYANGRFHQTESIRLQVYPRGHSPDQSQPEENLFIRTIPRKQTVFENQQMVVEYQLYFSEDYQINRTQLAGQWKTPGFWREDLNVSPRPMPDATRIHGQRFYHVPLKRTALFPTGTGEMEISGVDVELHVRRRRQSSGNYQHFPFTPRLERLSISAPTLSVQVKPLPMPKPDGFTGAVGTFELQSQLNQTTVPSGTPVELTVTVSGEGNLPTLGEPDLSLPSSVHRLDVRTETNVQRSADRLSGSKTFTYTLAPEQQGLIEFPPARLIYFDPATQEYQTATATPHRLQVEAVRQTAAAADTSAIANSDTTEQTTEQTSWIPKDLQQLYESSWTYWAFVLPLLLLGAAWAIARLRASQSHPTEAFDRIEEAYPYAQKRLGEARTHLSRDETAAYYHTLEDAVRGFIGRHLEIPTRGLTYLEIHDRLAEEGVPEETRSAVSDLLAESEEARFAPSQVASERMKTAVDRTARCIAALDGFLTSAASDSPENA